jgi:hypothetical protein
MELPFPAKTLLSVEKGKPADSGPRPNAAKQKRQVVEKSAVQMNFWVN